MNEGLFLKKFLESCEKLNIDPEPISIEFLNNFQKHRHGSFERYMKSIGF
ncbi:hypothetical protein ACFL1H_03170 [Nanoarchaeota archaeon]